MKILDRYIGSQVILHIAIVTFALLGVDIFFYFVNELRIVGRGDYTISSAIIFIALVIPRKIYIIFPWAALLGSLLALGNLSKHSELVAMRAATISVPRIAFSALRAGMLLTIIMFVCGEIVSPYTETWAQQKKTEALSFGQAIQTQFGTWIRHNDEFIHIEAVDGLSLQNITRYMFNEDMNLQKIENAQHAEKVDENWNLYAVQESTFNDNCVTNSKSEVKEVPELLDEEVLQTSKVKHLECLTIIKLWRVIKSRLAQDLNALEYQRAFWMKMMQPVAALVMVFLAVPFAFGPLRSSSMGLKIVIGIMMGFSFHTLNSIFGPLTSVIGLSPMIAAMMPAIIFFMLGYFMLLRVR